LVVCFACEQKSVLDALGIQHGPGHGEVIVTNTGPVLVECGARPHGAEGTFIPLARDCFGRDQVSMTVDCYIDKKAFDEYKDLPRLRKFAFKVRITPLLTYIYVALTLCSFGFVWLGCNRLIWYVM
jgi:hypothetical protein